VTRTRALSSGWNRPATAAPPASSAISVHASGRYLTRNGSPLILIGDTCWSLIGQASTTQITDYIADRYAKGCNAILFSAPEVYYTAQTPRYRNVGGDDPFTSMTGNYNWVINDAYWDVVDHAVNELNSRNMVAMINPAYWGQSGDGCYAELVAQSDATLEAYGASLANRYTQGNVIWCVGGDATRTTGDRDKQWAIITGIRSVRTTDLVTGHTGRAPASPDGTNGEAYLGWGTGYTGFSLNNTYLRDDADDQAGPHTANAYGRSGPVPFFMIEAGYEPATDAMLSVDIVPTIRSILGGGLAGGFAGHDVLWHLGTVSPDDVGTASTLSNDLPNSWTEFGYLGTMIQSYSWHLLVPKTDTSLVTTSKGSGSTLISPARASDGSFAMIHTPTQNFTVDMTALTPSSVRGRWWNWSDGTYSTASGSPFANTGTQAFTAPGDRVLILDAA